MTTHCKTRSYCRFS